MRHERPCHQHRAEQVHLDRLHPRIPVDLLDRAHRAVDAGVVDERREIAEALERPVDERCTEAGSETSAGDRQHAILVARERHELLARALEVGGGPAADADTGPGVDERARDLETQSLAGARDEGAAADEVDAGHDALPTWT